MVLVPNFPNLPETSDWSHYWFCTPGPTMASSLNNLRMFVTLAPFFPIQPKPYYPFPGLLYLPPNRSPTTTLPRLIFL